MSLADGKPIWLTLASVIGPAAIAIAVWGIGVEGRLTAQTGRLSSLESRNVEQDKHIDALDKAGTRLMPVLEQGQRVLVNEVKRLSDRIDALTAEIAKVKEQR